MMPKPGGVTLVFGKLQRKTSGGPGTLLCLSIVIFISRSHSSFLRTYILPQSFFFSFFVLLFISHSLMIVLLHHTPSSLRPFDESYMPPPKNSVSLPFPISCPPALLLPLPLLPKWLASITVCHLAELQVESVIVLLMVLLRINLLIFLIYFQMSNPRSSIWVKCNGNAAAANTGK